MQAHCTHQDTDTRFNTALDVYMCCLTKQPGQICAGEDSDVVWLNSGAGQGRLTRSVGSDRRLSVRDVAVKLHQFILGNGSRERGHVGALTPGL